MMIQAELSQISDYWDTFNVSINLFNNFIRYVNVDTHLLLKTFDSLLQKCQQNKRVHTSHEVDF